MKKKTLALALALLLVCVSTTTAFAHPGGLDKYGGHNGPSGYHYHNGGGSSGGSNSGGAGDENVDALADRRVTSVEIVEPGAEIFVGDEFSLECKFLPDTAYPQHVSWEISDEDIVVESGQNKFTAKGSGQVTITANEYSYENKDSITIEVLERPIDSIVLIAPEQKIHAEGEPIEVRGSISPDNASKDGLSWSVSDEKIAKIEDGRLTPLSPGKVLVRVEAKSGASDSIEIEVLKRESAALQTLGGLVLISGIVGFVLWRRKKKRQ